MEKVIELLNEYERKINSYSPGNFSNYKWNLVREEKSWYYDNWVSDSYMEEVEYSDSIIISKKYWFIKWLVENDKIDFNKDALISLSSELWCSARDEKIVLMVLSISDTPIIDLINYLK